ncbi:hypothetical protein DFP73DRAFT_229627 [Morchella snyderi]|nr:hypothetical protein DFP73DRAFT_229627 [Morchella snyderi]
MRLLDHICFQQELSFPSNIFTMFYFCLVFLVTTTFASELILFFPHHVFRFLLFRRAPDPLKITIPLLHFQLLLPALYYYLFYSACTLLDCVTISVHHKQSIVDSSSTPAFHVSVSSTDEETQ